MPKTKSDPEWAEAQKEAAGRPEYTKEAKLLIAHATVAFMPEVRRENRNIPLQALVVKSRQLAIELIDELLK